MFIFNADLNPQHIISQSFHLALITSDQQHIITTHQFVKPVTCTYRLVLGSRGNISPTWTKVYTTWVHSIHMALIAPYTPVRMTRS